MTHSSRIIKACVPLYKTADTLKAILKLDKEELRETTKSVDYNNSKKEKCANNLSVVLLLIL